MKKAVVGLVSLMVLAVPATFAMQAATGSIPSAPGISTKIGLKGMTHTPDFTKLPQSVQDALKAQGISIPSTDEVQAFQTKMQSEREAMKNLSEADRASLQTLREEFKKKEREFLRSKGVDMPTEDQIAQMKKLREAVQTEIGKLPYSEVKKLKKEFKKNLRDNGAGEYNEDTREGFRGPGSRR